MLYRSGASFTKHHLGGFHTRKIITSKKKSTKDSYENRFYTHENKIISRSPICCRIFHVALNCLLRKGFINFIVLSSERKYVLHVPNVMVFLTHTGSSFGAKILEYWILSWKIYCSFGFFNIWRNNQNTHFKFT